MPSHSAPNDFCLGTFVETPVDPGSKGISIIAAQSGRTIGSMGASLYDDIDIECRRNAHDF